MDLNGVPVEFPLYTSGAVLRGKEWGFKDGVPIIALHGWLDNCATWDRTIPLLYSLNPTFRFHIIALDFAGHGFSDHRHPQADYSALFHVEDILQVVDLLSWTQFGLLGHSLGGLVAVLLAGLFPERVLHLTVIEVIAPFHLPSDSAVERLRGGVTSKLAYYKKGKSTKRVFGSVEEAMIARAHGLHAMSEDASRILVERGLISVKSDVHGSENEQRKAFVWSTDPRLILTSSLSLSKDVATLLISRVNCPMLILMADQYECYLMLEPYKSVLEGKCNEPQDQDAFATTTAKKAPNPYKTLTILPDSSSSSTGISGGRRKRCADKRSVTHHVLQGISSHHLHLESDSAEIVAQKIVDFYNDIQIPLSLSKL